MDSARNTGVECNGFDDRSVRRAGDAGRRKKKGAGSGRSSFLRYAREEIGGNTMPWHDEELWDDAPFELELEA
jgi:hypothetical protein